LKKTEVFLQVFCGLWVVVHVHITYQCRADSIQYTVWDENAENEILMINETETETAEVPEREKERDRENKYTKLVGTK
jgi:hypothetical protein